MTSSLQIGVIGLGYVGLPLAVEFGKLFPTVGFDLKTARIEELRRGIDSTLETDPQALREATHLSFTSNADDLKHCNFYIVSVPTPIDEHKQPDMTLLMLASETIGKVLKPGDYAVFESTVYPGATEEVCVPIIERVSGFTLNRDFYVGYSPERINPGDHAHRLPEIVKITSGSTAAAADYIDHVYQHIISAGTHKASSIRVAEAAKVIENTQRDLNIALMNEIAIICHRLGIDTLEVLEAAGTKWNFLPFRPGLVGGHCIGVDPYYLTHKAIAVGYHPQLIIAGRRINDDMGYWVAEEVIKLMLRQGQPVLRSRILILGLTFKENCPDIRNTRVIDLIDGLRQYHAEVDIYDPWINPEEARDEYGLECIEQLPDTAEYDAVIVAVAHRQFARMGEKRLRRLGKQGAVLYDLKGALPAGAADGRL